MNGDAQSSDDVAAGSSRLVLECDARGRVLWMSAGTRSALGPVSSLAEAVQAARRTCPAQRFSGVWLPSGTVWISARPAGTPWRFAAREDPGAFERAAMRRLFLVEEVERSLAALTRTRRRSRNIVGLLELERQRLARELHTGIGQVLAAIRLQSEIISNALVTHPDAVREATERIATLVENGLDQARALSHRLHPPEWQRLTLAAAIRQLWDLSGVPQQFAASLRIGAVSEEPGLEVNTIVYRTVQEALSNIALHAAATRVELELEVSGGWVRVMIRDNGVGFDVAEYLSRPPGAAAGIGLRSLREQAAGSGGRLDVKSGSAGTTVALSIPLHLQRPE